VIDFDDPNRRNNCLRQQSDQDDGLAHRRAGVLPR
jgi:hypothetical protein